MRSSGDMFTFQPTFTQGLILGQFSILVLLAAILKYLFLDTERSQKVPVYADPAPPALQPSLLSAHVGEDSARVESEPTEWLNILLHQIAGVYRSKLRDDLQGIEGDEIVRQRVEDFVNRMRPSGILDRIQVHSVHLGVSAPQLSNACSIPVVRPGLFERNEFDMVYKDDLSISLSTAYLFNYPTFGFARLPVSLTISLSVFSCRAVITPPSPSSPAPALTLMVLPNFTLELQSRSLLGSRAKLADVPKLHELIDSQIRRAISSLSRYNNYVTCNMSGKYLFGRTAPSMASLTSNIVFDDIFVIKKINPDGKKFDRVSRLHAVSKNYSMDLTLDYNSEIFPLNIGQDVALALASSLARGPAGSQEGAEEEDRDRDVWRPDAKGRRGLEDDYGYVMYGRVYRFDPGTGEVVTAYASFGGMLMSLTGSFRHMTNIVLGDPVFLLMRK